MQRAIWFPSFLITKKAYKTKPKYIIKANPSCYEEIDFSSISGNFYNATLINNNNDSIFIGSGGGGLADSGNLACTDVSINNRDISFKIPSFNKL